MNAFITTGLLLAAPVLHGLGALISHKRSVWGLSNGLSALALAAAIAAAVATLLAQSPTLGFAYFLPASFSPLLAAMIALLGWIIMAFSRNYLAGEPPLNVARYLQMLHFALAVVMVTILTDHIAVLLVGWAAISFAIHELLLHYRQRQLALIAARKKFLVARAAELLLLVAAFILVDLHETWSISQILSVYPRSLTTLETVAACLIAAAALIKCAQIPAHGWLLQVVEAPTPVSALLHAGIVNMGGYLLILCGALVTSALSAQLLIITVAGLTLVIASGKMQRESTVKVKLAWSTCSQMALMLIEAALGFYELALLHLFAHSLYKAHQFLRSGSTVDWVNQAAIAAQQPTSVPARIFASTVVVVAIAAAVYATGDTAHLPSWLLLGALASVILARVSVSTFVTRIAAAVVILGLFMLQRALVGEILAVQMLPAQAPSVALLFTDAIFALLWLGWTLDLNRLAVPAKMTAGLEELAQGVDDRLTALTFSIWPHNSPSGLLEDGPTPERPVAPKHNIMELK